MNNLMDTMMNKLEDFKDKRDVARVEWEKACAQYEAAEQMLFALQRELDAVEGLQS